MINNELEGFISRGRESIAVAKSLSVLLRIGGSTSRLLNGRVAAATQRQAALAERKRYDRSRQPQDTN
jgi:hypothetical protein